MNDSQFKVLKGNLKTMEQTLVSGGIPKDVWDGFDPRNGCEVAEKKSAQRSVLLTYCRTAALSGLFSDMNALEVGVEKHQSVCIALGLKDWKRMDRLDDVGGNHIDYVCDFVEDGTPAETIDNFDFVVCSNTLEHTFDIVNGFETVFSMAKNGAVLYFSMPFMVDVHGDEHDYWRMTPACMDKFMERYARDHVVLREQSGNKLLGVSCFAWK